MESTSLALVDSLGAGEGRGGRLHSGIFTSVMEEEKGEEFVLEGRGGMDDWGKWDQRTFLH